MMTRIFLFSAATAAAILHVVLLTSLLVHPGGVYGFVSPQYGSHDFHRLDEGLQRRSLASALWQSSLPSDPSLPADNHHSSYRSRAWPIFNSKYGEQSRKYRRTIYTHEDWVKHRSPLRFFQKAMTFHQSGIYANVIRPVTFVTGIATLTVLWNTCLVRKWSKLPSLGLPISPFQLASASLGLLLVFRTNTGYARWDEARKNWGLNINRTRDLMRMAVAWTTEEHYEDIPGIEVANHHYHHHNNNDDDDGKQQSMSRSSTSTVQSKSQQRQEDLTTLAQCAWAFVRSMKRHLSPDEEDEEAFRDELLQRLPRRQAYGIIQANHRPNRAIFDLSVAIEQLPIHFLRKSQLHNALTIFEDNLGSSERLLTSPVPLFYSRHTARFLLFWTSLLPLALYESFILGGWNPLLLIPTSFFLSTFLFGIEELANQMEEPFTILPQQGFCDNIYTWCMEITQWKAGDNGMKVRSSTAAAATGTTTASTNTNTATTTNMGYYNNIINNGAPPQALYNHTEFM